MFGTSVNRALAGSTGRMKILLGTVAALGLGIASHAQAQTLFTTVNDFNQWSVGGGTGGGSTLYDSDGSATNGLGNTTAAGGAGTAGSLSVTLSNPSNTYQFPAFSAGEQGNQAFLSTLDPGAVAGTSLAAYSGTLDMTYTTPTNNGGSYYEIGVVLNYDGNFGQFFQSSAVNETIDGQPTTVATIPYTISATSLSYFQLGIIFNSNYAPTTPFYVDNISVPSVPEPASIGMLGAGMTLLTLRRRRKASV